MNLLICPIKVKNIIEERLVNNNINIKNTKIDIKTKNNIDNILIDKIINKILSFKNERYNNYFITIYSVNLAVVSNIEVGQCLYNEMSYGDFLDFGRQENIISYLSTDINYPVYVLHY